MKGIATLETTGTQLFNIYIYSIFDYWVILCVPLKNNFSRFPVDNYDVHASSKHTRSEEG
jgi:hypothetical protein